MLRLLVIAAAAASLYAQRVTETRTVRIDGKPQVIRKINGRWWSPDNRQLTPPGKHESFWHIQNKRSAEVGFHHHRPVDLARAESLRLFMTKDEVTALLGPPNETFEGMGGWWYYAENGVALFVRFLGAGEELGAARYERGDFGIQGRPVQSIERELAGRSVFAVFARRASTRSRSFQQAEPPSSAPIPVAVAPEPPRRTIDRELAASVAAGMTRDELVGKLGAPYRTSRIAGSDVDVETLTYAIAGGGEVRFRFEDGKLAKAQ
jgi:outer membrane protein assembly factor BamE (lipoprotein component of BamABCDE complex)